MQKIYAFLFFLLIFFTFFLRFYKLTEFPPSLYQDETAIGYNAYLILEKGVDEYGKSFPVYFQSFGDYKLPVYIYTTAVFMKIFGYGEFAVRAPSALAGSLSVILLFILLRRLTKDNGLAFTASFLLAINPWHLQFSRAGFEVNLALFFALLGTTFFIVGIEEKKYLLIPAALSFALSLYSYNVTRLLIPLFIILLVALYWPKLRKISFAYLTFLNIFMLVLLLPFLQTLFMSSGVYSAKTNLISSTDILVKNVEMRSYLESLPGWYTKLFYNNYIAIFLQYIQNIANIISGSFFFTQGTPHPNQGIGNVGTFYLFELPFFVLGIIIFFTKKIHSLRVFFWWLIVTVLTLALSKDVPHATRGYFLVIPIIVFTAQGILFFFEYLKHMHIYPLLKNVLVGLTLLFCCI